MDQAADILPGERIIAIQTDHMSARRPAADGGILGPWWSVAHAVSQWDAGDSQPQPAGRVELLPHGHFTLHFGDAVGWRPYLSVSGIEPQAPVQCVMRYRFDGTEVWDTVPLNWADGRHVGIGGISDGSLGGSNRFLGIQLACIGGFPGNSWGFSEVTFGLVMLGEPA